MESSSDYKCYNTKESSEVSTQRKLLGLTQQLSKKHIQGRKAECAITFKLAEVVAHIPHVTLQKDNHIYIAVNQLISCTSTYVVHSATKEHEETLLYYYGTLLGTKRGHSLLIIDLRAIIKI